MGNVMYCAGRIMSHPSPVSKQQESDRINTNVSEDGFNSFPFPLRPWLEHPSRRRRKLGNTIPTSIHPKCKGVNFFLGSPTTSGPRWVTLATFPGEHGQASQPGIAKSDPEGCIQLPLCSEMLWGTCNIHVGHSTCTAPT